MKMERLREHFVDKTPPLLADIFELSNVKNRSHEFHQCSNENKVNCPIEVETYDDIANIELFDERKDLHETEKSLQEESISLERDFYNFENPVVHPCLSLTPPSEIGKNKQIKDNRLEEDICCFSYELTSRYRNHNNDPIDSLSSPDIRDKDPFIRMGDILSFYVEDEWDSGFLSSTG